MTWIWILGAAFFLIAALSIYGAFRSPEFVYGLIAVMVAAAYRAMLPVVAKRLPAEKEQEWRDAIRRADGGEEWRRKRLGLPPKG